MKLPNFDEFAPLIAVRKRMDAKDSGSLKSMRIDRLDAVEVEAAPLHWPVIKLEDTKAIEELLQPIQVIEPPPLQQEVAVPIEIEAPIVLEATETNPAEKVVEPEIEPEAPPPSLVIPNPTTEKLVRKSTVRPATKPKRVKASRPKREYSTIDFPRYKKNVQRIASRVLAIVAWNAVMVALLVSVMVGYKKSHVALTKKIDLPAQSQAQIQPPKPEKKTNPPAPMSISAPAPRITPAPTSAPKPSPKPEQKTKPSQPTEASLTSPQPNTKSPVVSAPVVSPKTIQPIANTDIKNAPVNSKTVETKPFTKPIDLPFADMKNPKTENSDNARGGDSNRKMMNEGQVNEENQMLIATPPIKTQVTKPIAPPKPPDYDITEGPFSGVLRGVGKESYFKVERKKPKEKKKEDAIEQEAP